MKKRGKQILLPALVLMDGDSPAESRPVLRTAATDASRVCRHIVSKQSHAGTPIVWIGFSIPCYARKCKPVRYSFPFSFLIFARIIFSLYSRKRQAPIRQVTVAMIAVVRYCMGDTTSLPLTMCATVMDVKTTMAMA